MATESVPFPPLELANRVCSLEGRGDPYPVFDRLGKEAKAALIGLLPDDWSFAGKQALDFGCGAGRTLRHFLSEAEDGSFWGVDIDARSIEWLQDALCPPLNVIQGPSAPPLALDSTSFDVVWALSVFTHLTDTSLAWLAELHRLLRPGGLLIATYMGRFNSEAYLSEQWSEDLVGMNVLRPDQGWDEGGPMVMMSDWWVRAHWGRAFEFINIAPEVHGQTWVLLRKRDVEITVEELERLEDDPRELPALRYNVMQAVREAEHRYRDASHAAVRAVEDRFETSVSWRITRPVRQVAGWVRTHRR
jgi:SAM-dependent methyltransferase